MRRPAIFVVAACLAGAGCSPTETDEALSASTTPPSSTIAATSTSPSDSPAPPTTTGGPVTTSTKATTLTPVTSTTSTTPTTIPAKPPSLVVTAPAEAGTVATRTFRFRGTTDPGCTVIAAGRYEADVAADGTWSIGLTLNRGGNVATFIATNPAGLQTTVRWPVYYEPPIPSIAWSPAPTLTTGSVAAIDAERGRFTVITGARGASKELWSSSDGYTWTSTLLPGGLDEAEVEAVADADFGYVLSDGSVLLVGSGRRWFEADLPVPEGWWWHIGAVVPGPSGAVVEISGGVSNHAVEELVWWTEDAATFETVLSAGNVPGAGGGALIVAGDDSRFVLVRQQRVTPPDESGPVEDWPVEHEILLSTDGRTWRPVTDAPFLDVAGRAPLWVSSLDTRAGIAVAAAYTTQQTEARLLRSTDLVHWTDVTPWPTPEYASAELEVGEAGWLLRTTTGENNHELWWSSDGVDWHSVTGPGDVTNTSAARVAIGHDSVLLAPDPYFDPDPAIWIGTPMSG